MIWLTRSSWLSWTILALALSGMEPRSACAAAEDGSQTGFVLEDLLGRPWRNEVVRFPLNEAQRRAAESGKALVGPEQKPVAYQVLPATDGQPARIAFQADLEPFERRVYQFGDAAAETKTDLQIEDTAEGLRIGNRHTGIWLRKSLADGAGPIAGVRLNSGKWVGGSRLITGQTLSSYAVEVAVQGPVLVEAVCRATFDQGGTWELRVRMEADEPVVLVDESFSLGDDSTFLVDVRSNFPADHLFFRHGTFPAVGRMDVWKIDPNEKLAYQWEPWLHWWLAERRGTWFGLYPQQGSDLLAVAARNPGVWVDPQKQRSQGNWNAALVQVEQAGEKIEARLPLGHGGRSWMFAALKKEESLALLPEADRRKTPLWPEDKKAQEPAQQEKVDLRRAPLPQQYAIKHGDFPLDRVKDYVLQWEGDDNDHPHMLITRKQVERFRQNFEADPKRLARLAQARISSLDEPLEYYLGTGDAALGRHLANHALAAVQQVVHMLLQQDHQVTLGFAPHHGSRGILMSLNAADPVWSTVLTPDERRRLKAQVAFLGYTVNRPAYWSVERGYHANPNMTTMVAAYRTAIAAAIPAHPRAQEWMERGMHEFKQVQLDTWADANGGWLEAPHYAMTSYDYIVGMFLMAHNAGLNDYLYDPKMKKVIEWFAKISTPPDSRYLDRRHAPPIGNTYVSEPSGEYGILAALWKEKDPRFAAEMQWMYQQQGEYPNAGVGGAFPALEGYRNLLLDPSIEPKAPRYGSELFPQTGVMLRSHFPSKRETQLHLIAGSHRDHYDYDSGSITFWGKGRIIADDWGYNSRHAAEAHSMIDAPGVTGGTMHVREFTPGEYLDYVRGEKNAWQRQIAFVKDADALGPNYVVLCDSFAQPTDATWRLWLTAEQVKPNQRGAQIIGQEDVDTDVFLVQPEQVRLTTEEKTCTPFGMNREGKFQRLAVTQTGLIAALSKSEGISTVLYPRLRTEQPPAFTAIADGRGVKIESPSGVDYVFLSREPFTFEQGDVRFEGTVGLVQIRDGKPRLSLGAAGSIAAGGHTLREPAE